MKKFLSVLMCAMLACVAFAGCGGAKEGKIRLYEVTHSIFYAPLYIAINNGYFKDAGLEIELTNVGGSDKVMTGITSKSADIGLLGPEATVYVIAEGRKDYPTVFGQLTRCDGSFLVGRVAEPDFTWSNLRNKRVLAGRTGGMPAMTLQYVVNQNGMTSPTDTNLDTSVAFDMMTPTFESDHSIDYTTMFEPAASEFVAAGKGHIVASIGAAAGEVPYTAFSANQSYLTKNKEQVKKFLTAVVKGYQYLMNESLDNVARALQPSFSTTSMESIKASIQSYKDVDAWAHTPVMNETAFNRLQDIMSNAGTLSKRADYAKTIDNSFAEAVMKDLGISA